MRCSGQNGSGAGSAAKSEPSHEDFPYAPYSSLEIVHLSLRHWLPRWLSGKESACKSRRRRQHGLDPWVRKIPWRRTWQPTPVFLPGESHGQRSLVGYIQFTGLQRVGTRQSDFHIHFLSLRHIVPVTSHPLPPHYKRSTFVINNNKMTKKAP